MNSVVRELFQMRWEPGKVLRVSGQADPGNFGCQEKKEEERKLVICH